MADISPVIQAALLLLLAFLIGCIIGWFLRAKIFRRRAPKSVAAQAKTVASVEPVKQQAVPVEIASEASTPPVAKPATAQKPKLARAKPRKAAIAAKPKPAPKSTATKGSPAISPDKPEGLTKPRGGNKDDLKKIKGIGPKLEGTLNGLGIYHFDQIASWSRKEIDWVDDFLSFKGRIERDQWIDQAKKLKE